jgi:amino acid adenylation domain-containing protein
MDGDTIGSHSAGGSDLMAARLLHDVLEEGLRRNPYGTAVREPDAEITYRELNHLVNRLARALVEGGVRPGDRVVIWLPKSINAVAAMQAVLRVGAAYVPVDPLSPAPRARQVIADSMPSVCVTEPGREVTVVSAAPGVGILLVGEDAGGFGESTSAAPLPPPPLTEDSLAYILYTSGSTGSPKGVCISHRNALAFIDWARDELRPRASDRFSSHAPFHFDLSVLDLYVAFASGASISLIPEGLTFVGPRLVEFVVREEISIWYSVPSALTMMMDPGGLLEARPASLKTIVFAGEPFPIVPLRRLRAGFPGVRMLNMYGPTETNVCTYYEVDRVPEECAAAVPIGRACSGDRVWAVTDDGTETAIGERGELLVDGPTVMLGYWGRRPHRGPYRTGDIVERLDASNYGYIGRRDGMVKIRGHRVELGEVEAAVSAHPSVREAAAVPVGAGLDTRLVAAVSFREGASASLLELKKACAQRLPRYMIVHGVRELPALPRTPNGKVDRRALKTICEEGSR